VWRVRRGRTETAHCPKVAVTGPSSAAAVRRRPAPGGRLAAAVSSRPFPPGGCLLTPPLSCPAPLAPPSFGRTWLARPRASPGARASGAGCRRDRSLAVSWDPLARIAPDEERDPAEHDHRSHRDPDRRPAADAAAGSRGGGDGSDRQHRRAGGGGDRHRRLREAGRERIARPLGEGLAGEDGRGDQRPRHRAQHPRANRPRRRRNRRRLCTERPADPPDPTI
jgi:hypothetical protein